MKKLITLFCCGFLLPSFRAPCVDPGPRCTLQLVFHNLFSGRPMMAGSSYQNAFGETFILKGFRYYISNIVLIEKGDRVHPLGANYFLVDIDQDSSQVITLRVDKKNYTGLQFLIGVDSLRNLRGTQTGVLDPLRGKFWTWNSGYITAKLEGVSPDSKAHSHLLTYHVGGYKKNEQTSRRITLRFAEPLQFPGNDERIHIQAEASTWFNGRHPIKIAEYPVCHEPGTLAVQLADNFEKMFSVVKPNP